jgi:hypothetical protein
MTAYCNRLLATALAAGLVGAVGATPAYAQINGREPDPAVWLRQIYDFYHRAEKSPALENKANDDLIVKRASKSLAALFKKNRDCEVKAKGICALDWDFVVDGQDYELSNITVGPAVISGDRATVTVTFNNLKEDDTNVYYFVREGGQWKVEDIETRQPSQPTTRISKLLRDYKY